MSVWDTVASLTDSAAATFGLRFESFLGDPICFRNGKIEGDFVGPDPNPDLYEASDKDLDLCGLDLLCSLATAGEAEDFVARR